MSDVLTRLDSNDLVGVVGIISGLAMSAAFGLSTAWSRMRRAQIAADLKRDMLDRGLSAEEIKTVLEAGV